MLAKRLEQILISETARTGFSHQPHGEIALRFRHLRGYRLLPRGRGKNIQHLSSSELAAAVLSVLPRVAGFAGLTSKVLIGLKPVGGTNASFLQSETFGDAIAALFENNKALDSLIEVRASDSEVFTSTHGHAAIFYLNAGEQKIAYFVPSTAISLFQPGAENSYDPSRLIPTVLTETIFRPNLFKKITRELQEEKSRAAMLHKLTEQGEYDEEDDEERQEEKRRIRLCITPASSFLNVGVDNQVTWPKEETLVEFEGYRLVLMPKTRKNSTSIHIDLHGNRLSDEDALTIINRFLSIMTWCDDQYAINQGGWSGNPVPVAVPKRDLAFTTAYHWVFDRRIPETEEKRKAIAIYREARNAEQNSSVGYAVLGYYKIIELRHKGRSDTKKWFRANFEKMRAEDRLAERIELFLASFSGQNPEDYLYTACRTAVAHANKPLSLDPDDLHEIRRMHVATNILRELARRFIKEELGVSTCIFDGS